MTAMVLHAILWSALAGDPGSSEKAFLAGAATVDVTPPKGMPMWGYGSRRDRPNEGVMDPLEANAAVVAVGADKLAFVGLDLGRAPTRKSMARIRERLKKEAGVGAFFIVGSHTHNGPVLELEDSPSTADPYVRTLEDKICQAVETAVKNLRPAKIGVASKEVPLNRNRHSQLPEKPVDRELAVISLVDLQNQPIATIVNFAAHPTSIPDSNMLYSADYPGPLKRQVEGKLGGVCVFLQGAAGDLSTNRGGYKDFADYGRALGDHVVDLARRAKPKVPAKPSIQVREEDFHFPDMRLDFSNGLVKAAFIRAFFKQLVDHYVEEYKDGSRPHLTVAILNGEIGLVGASGEFFCDHSLQLKRRSRLPYTLFFGYCNDYHNYFPTIQGAAEGGYGADPAVSPVSVGAGEHILNRALFHLYDMQGKFKTRIF